MSEGWDRKAQDWIAWARTPGHDSYWDCRDAFFELVPPPRGAALEVGCGEGRVTRDLTARGHPATGLDASPTLIAAAREADPDGVYVVGRAERLPFRDEQFDLVLSYNVLMNVDDMPGAVSEASRVLRSGGRLCACVVHPLASAGRFESRADDAAFVIHDSYFARRRLEQTFERGGLRMTFVDRTYPLESYARAFEGAGLLIESLREPTHTGDNVRRRRIPLFLFFRAVKP